MQKTKNPLIFIIEDSIVYKDLIVGFLKSKGFGNLKIFKTGDECLKELEQKPDLIILDYCATHKTGLELMIQIMNDNPEVDFIFLSGQNDLEVAVKIMKLGAADYIIKNEEAPYKLVAAIDRLVRTTKKRKQAQGFKIGVVGFFIMLFLVIMIIIFMSVFLNIEF